MTDVSEFHAGICKAFSNSARLKILYLLEDGELSVSEIVDRTGFSQSVVSQHLAVMRAKGAVVDVRDGKNVFYKIGNDNVLKIMKLVRKIAEGLNEES